MAHYTIALTAHPMSTGLKDLLANLKARVADLAGVTRLQSLKAEIARLDTKVATYRHAFETTAVQSLKAEIARLDTEVATYRHAFETTAADRDNYQSKYRNLAKGLEVLLSSPLLPPLAPLASPPTAERLLDNEQVRQCLSPQEFQAYSSHHVPNAYCVGAPKSGTSFFYSILREHPDFSMVEKDAGGTLQLAYLLNPGVEPARRKNCIEQYLKTVNAGYSNEALLCDFDVGVAHLAPVTAQLIHERLNAGARILFFLRDPVLRAVSQYVMRVRQYDARLARFAEPLSFWEAIEQESQRKATAPYIYQMYHAHVKMSRYSSLVEPFVETFGATNVKVILFEEEIVTNLESTILDTFAFLGVRDMHAVRLAGTDHQSYADASRRADEITVSFRDSSGKSHEGEAIKKVPAEQVTRITIVTNVSTDSDTIVDNPSAADVAAAQTLVERHSLKLTFEQERELYDRCFREDVTNLERLIERDLSIWYQRYE